MRAPKLCVIRHLFMCVSSHKWKKKIELLIKLKIPAPAGLRAIATSQTTSAYEHIQSLNETSIISWGVSFSCPLPRSRTERPFLTMHLSHGRKQDGSDSRISPTLEPQLFQSTLPYSTAPFHKVCWGTGRVAGTLIPDLIPWAPVWPFFLGWLFDVNARLVSTPASDRMRSLYVFCI